MGWFSGIVVFLLIWWTALFAVLPWGLKRDKDGTPQNPYLLKKFLITTGISAMLWLVVFGLIEINIIDFRQIAGTMIEEDLQ